MPGIYNTFLILDTIIVISLLALSVIKKHAIIGEKSREIISQRWKIFSATVFFSVIAVFLFLIYEIMEFYILVFLKNETTAMAEMEKTVALLLSIAVFLMLSLNLYLVYLIIFPEKSEKGEKSNAYDA